MSDLLNLTFGYTQIGALDYNSNPNVMSRTNQFTAGDGFHILSVSVHFVHNGTDGDFRIGIHQSPDANPITGEDYLLKEDLGVQTVTSTGWVTWVSKKRPVINNNEYMTITIEGNDASRPTIKYDTGAQEDAAEVWRSDDLDGDETTPLPAAYTTRANDGAFAFSAYITYRKIDIRPKADPTWGGIMPRKLTF